ncbi:chromosome segregation protein SMC [Legionella sp. D16C41]|uniref:chromosome segregation protein SMC n=1 Tax=Legionella sp. D16C41 TaxID=3402688 RepID=UPI003AF55C2A
MHLKQLKLVGFKSFVDPTTLPFPSHLVAVVGPNGCGKSNIIDAVKWVLGESSARNLRGESLIDVIFNGSTSRKAVGQASVELIFDNSLGRIGGQYSNYQEIAIKRLVARDGNSTYFLNGTRCRRRDINDLFLGTGAGARGYSIISQGTISKIVEAQPEELRAYLEEAAGISKYKERRRETVVRINHTRENLARVSDIREELTKQLQRLERQAKAAGRYQELKQLENTYKAEVVALKWQDLNNKAQQLETQLNQLSTEDEQCQTQLTQFYNQNTALKIQIEQAEDESASEQAQFYQLTTVIARLEEQVQQQHHERQRLLVEKEQCSIKQQELTNQLTQEKHLLIDYEHTISSSVAKLEDAKKQLVQQQQDYYAIQQEQRLLQKNIEQVQSKLAQVEKEIQIQQVHTEHINGEQQSVQLRLEKNKELLYSLNHTIETIDLAEHEGSLKQLESKKNQQESDCQALINSLGEVRQCLVQAETNLHKIQDHYHQLKTAHAAVVATIATAVKLNTSSAISNLPQVFETITVAKEWQYACEIVLKDILQAVMVDSLKPILNDLAKLIDTPQSFTVTQANTVKQKNYPCLADKITGPLPYFLPSLYKIFTASTIKEACDWFHELNQDESIITKEGCWIAKGWVRISGKTTSDSFSLLAKQEELNTLTSELKQVENHLINLKQERDTFYLNLQAIENELILAKSELEITQDEIRVANTEIDKLCLKQNQLSLQKKELLMEGEQLEQRLIDLAEQAFKIEQIVVNTLPLKQQLQKEQKHLGEKKQNFELTFLDIQKKVEDIRTLVYQLEIENERNHLAQKQLIANIAHNQDKLISLNKRLEAISTQLITSTTSNHSLEEELATKLESYKIVEKNLKIMRAKLNDFKVEFVAREAKIKAEEKQIKNLQEKMQQLQLELQTFRAQIGNLLDRLKEQGFQAPTLLKNLPPETTIMAREQQITAVIEKINRLGAINLAAIEEYTSEAQRKNYLDEQYNDLENALTMLEAAIEKLDKETRSRFQQTFNEVNVTFQSLFPRLFGGGEASLELTGNNWLEAGVLITAKPPGKRNNTIYLLSGGEKAMTAVALIFAIFQLNPSPFCMLDEVDAPLDDVNVGRFCALVKEMSKIVQFLFITHNKLTMELAEHLIGVTMREPGVSRIVAVDVGQALAISEAK